MPYKAVLEDYYGEIVDVLDMWRVEPQINRMELLPPPSFRAPTERELQWELQNDYRRYRMYRAYRKLGDHVFYRRVS